MTSPAVPATFVNAKFVKKTLDIPELMRNASAVVIQDSVRAGEFKLEPKLVATYLASAGAWQMYGDQLLEPYLQSIDKSYRMDVSQILFTGATMPLLARIFGGSISFQASLMTSAGTQFFSKGLEMAMNKKM